jgi:hypothetical protein
MYRELAPENKLSKKNIEIGLELDHSAHSLPIRARVSAVLASEEPSLRVLSKETETYNMHSPPTAILDVSPRVSAQSRTIEGIPGGLQTGQISGGSTQGADKERQQPKRFGRKTAPEMDIEGGNGKVPNLTNGGRTVAVGRAKKSEDQLWLQDKLAPRIPFIDQNGGALAQQTETRRAAQAEELATKASELKAETEKKKAEIERELKRLSESFSATYSREMLQIDDELAHLKGTVDKEQDSERKERLKIRRASYEERANAYLAKLQESYYRKRTELTNKLEALQDIAQQKLEEFEQRQTKELAEMDSMVKKQLQLIAQLKMIYSSISVLSNPDGPTQV